MYTVHWLNQINGQHSATAYHTSNLTLLLQSFLLTSSGHFGKSISYARLFLARITEVAGLKTGNICQLLLGW